MIWTTTIWPIVFAIHILCAVIWVGGMFFALLVLRPSLGVLEPAQRLQLHSQVFRRFFLIIWHAMPLALISGYAMLLGVFGGFAGAGWSINLMMLLGLIMAALFLVVFFGPWARFRYGTDPARAADSIRRLILVNLVLGLVTVCVAAVGRW
ncbi:MAG TPA: CopD family protein [Acetobacteraceae bacterium]|nr:CopD family protein [Acetobacteraceae bacterium]